MLTVGSLFSGIGGLDLGLERAGMKVIWQSEIDPYCNKVLNKHWPEVTNHGNIKEIDWTTVQRPDVICGGYPCQPFSTAGKRRGTDDPRHLWPWVRDAISALRPSYAILENVRGHLSMGGLQVIGELAEIGYDAEWRVVSAAGVGAPHRRDRIIIVAYPSQLLSNGSDNNPKVSMGSETLPEFGNSSGPARMAYANDSKLGDINECGINEKSNAERRKVFVTNSPGSSNGRTDSNWILEPNVGRVADGVSDRVDRLRGLGNAVVPQVAEYIGHLVMAAHNNT